MTDFKLEDLFKYKISEAKDGDKQAHSDLLQYLIYCAEQYADEDVLQYFESLLMTEKPSKLEIAQMVQRKINDGMRKGVAKSSVAADIFKSFETVEKAWTKENRETAKQIIEKTEAIRLRKNT